MKILEERYPMGSIKGQRTPGRYIDETLWENIKILAKTIVKDMTFLVNISSSTLEVGTGKSVFAQQFCEAYLEAVRQQHNIDNRLEVKNIVFRPQELIKRAFDVPQYSCVILDEWEDAHYWSALGMSLRQFFRKCRQLNLMMVCIIPNFFQLPMNYACSRSVAFIDVKFQGEFDRGYFDFYNFATKRTLYLQGKKTQNYNVVKPNFSGRFVDGYAIDEMVYRKAKRDDMLKEENEQEKKLSEKHITIKIFRNFRENVPDLPIRILAQGFGVSERTGNRYLSDNYDTLDEKNNCDTEDKTTDITYLTEGEGESGENSKAPTADDREDGLYDRQQDYIPEEKNES